MNLDSLNYKSYVDRAYKYFLMNKEGDAKLDNMLDKIDNYDNYQGVEYYVIDAIVKLSLEDMSCECGSSDIKQLKRGTYIVKCTSCNDQYKLLD